MHLKSLKIFCDVVARRSFSRAATDNGISQSGASQVVHQLEKGLGVRLIDRSKRPFVLTPEGQAYYSGCLRLVQEYYQLEDAVRTLSDEVAGRVVVASIYSVGLHHMNPYLQRFLAQYPKANVRLEYLHPDAVYNAVESDQADLGLVSYPRDSRSLQALPWKQESMVMVCPPDHPLACVTTVTLEAVHGERMVCFEPSLAVRREIDRALTAHSVEIQVVNEFDNIETMKRAIEVGTGISLLPEPAVAREVEAGTLTKIPLATGELIRPLGIVHRRGKELTGTARRFLDCLLDQGRSTTRPQVSLETTAAPNKL